MIAALLTQQLTIETITDGALDRYGHPSPTISASSVVQGHVQQATASEELGGHQVAAETANCWLPDGTVIGERDRVVVDGVTWQVDGPPWRVFNPRTQTVSHIKVRLRRAQ